MAEVGFQNIKKIHFKLAHLQEAFGFLNYAGIKSIEGVALFAGIHNDDMFTVKKVIIPEQVGYILEGGLMYAVDSDEIYRINVWLYENQQTLIGQIHSHPSEAYHSKADDRFPIVDTIGGLSMVVPNFAKGDCDVFDWANYRLSVSSTWELLSPSQIENLIIVD